ncbi:MAG: lipoyl synthase [Candidatus Aminicenantes bacterium]|nr:lipoyl synthase [Candidatus Aminicenantes bacterium]
MEIKIEKKPSWLKIKFPTHDNFFIVSNIVKGNGLHTICRSAKCPNVTECWSHKTATFLILGDTCTRKCAFCAVKKGKPNGFSSDEPRRIADAVEAMELNYVVVTSVTRDDLDDGGAEVFAHTIAEIRSRRPGTKIEVLIPDFQGEKNALDIVLDANPEVLNHNLETTRPMYPNINRPVENYGRSLEVLERAHKGGAVTKSGLMVGLGEGLEEIIQAFSDLRGVSVNLLTIGQYLQPTRNHAPVRKYYTPAEFKQLKNIALDFGFDDVESGPLVRSSYRAHKLYNSVNGKPNGTQNT